MKPALTHLAASLATIMFALGPVPFAVAQSAQLDEVRQLVREQQFDQALARLDEHLQESPRDPEGRFIRGVVLAEQNKADEAIDVFKDLTRDHPDLPEPHNNLAVLLASKGDYAGARDALLVAINTHPSYATAHENLGDIYAKMAGIAYGKALQLNVGNESAKTKLALAREIVSTKIMPGTNIEPVVVEADAPPPPSTVDTAVATVETTVASVASDDTVAAADSDDATSMQAMEAVVESVEVESSTDITPSSDETSDGEIAVSSTTAVAVADEEAVLQQGTSNSVQEEILSTVYGWASAWSNQDIEQYLSFYGEAYQPSQGRSRADWEANRRDRLQKPSFIEVTLSEPEVDLRGVDSARVRFLQTYRSDTYEDQIRKLVSLVWTGSEWKIVRERTVN